MRGKIMIMVMLMMTGFLLRIRIQLLILLRIETRKTTHPDFLIMRKAIQSRAHLLILKQIDSLSIILFIKI